MPVAGLDQLIQEAKSLSDLLQSVEFPSDNPEVREGTTGLEIDGVPLSKKGMQAISKKFKIGPGYIAHCPRKLQALNLNYWFTETKAKEKYRFFAESGAITKVVDKEAPIVQDMEVLEAVGEAFSDNGSSVFVDANRTWFSSDVSNVSLYVASRETVVKEKDTLYPGFTIQNSITGQKPLIIGAYVYRTVCTNGMRVPIGGYNREMIFDSGDPKTRIRDFLIDSLPSAELETQRLAALNGVPVSDPMSVVLSMATHVGFSQAQRVSLLRRVTPEIQTMYDVINLFTSYANGLPARLAANIQSRAGHAAQIASGANVCSQCHSVVNN